MGFETDNPFSKFTRMWLETAAQAMQTCEAAAGSASSPEIVRKGRSDLLQLWSDACEEFMRSSTFLEAQKQSLDAALAFRKQIRTNLRRMLRELQLAGREDIDALVATLRRSENRVLGQLEDISERLHAIETTLADLGERLERAAGHGEQGIGHSDDESGGPGPAMASNNGGKKKRRIDVKE